MTHPNPAAEQAPHQPPAQPAPQQAQQPNQQAPQQHGQPAGPQQQQPPQPPSQPQGGFPPGPPPGAMPPPGWQGQPGHPGGPGGPTGPVPVMAPATAPASSGVTMTPATWCRLAALLATPLGLSIPFDSSCMWVSMTAWAAFAMLAAIVQAVPVFKGASGASVSKDWTIGAVGAGSLVLFWVLVGLPSVASNSGFTLTVAAVAAAAGAVIAPGRRW